MTKSETFRRWFEGVIEFKRRTSDLYSVQVMPANERGFKEDTIFVAGCSFPSGIDPQPADLFQFRMDRYLVDQNNRGGDLIESGYIIGKGADCFTMALSHSTFIERYWRAEKAHYLGNEQQIPKDLFQESSKVKFGDFIQLSTRTTFRYYKRDGKVLYRQ